MKKTIKNIFIFVLFLAVVLGGLFLVFRSSSLQNSPTPQPYAISNSGGAILHYYKNNLEIDGITLEDGSVTPDQILFLVPLHMSANGLKLSQYSIYKRDRWLDTTAPVQLFDAFYYSDDKYWLVSYISKDSPYKICDVKLKPNGQLLEEITCKDA